MKTAICLVSICLLASFASSEFAWRSGQVYNYDVRGRLMTGVTKISNQNAGLEVTYRMTILVKGPNTIVLKPSKYQVIETNEEVEGGWREGDFTQGTQSQISPQFLKYLEAPMKAEVLRGVITTITVPSGMPTWAENIKRAQASHFIIDSTGSNVVLEGNLNRNTNVDSNIVRPQNSQADFENDMSGFFYETMEQTVHGECKTSYTVSQTGPLQSFYQYQAQAQPEISPAVQPNKQSSSSSEEDNNGSNSESGEVYQQGELPWPKVLPNFCKSTDQIYEVVKVMNFTQCKQKAVFAHIHPSELLRCRPGDNRCGSSWGRVVQTRFLLCGTNRRSYNILKITQDEFFSFGLNKEHTIFGGVVYNSTINNIQQATSEHAYEILNPKILENLVYNFDPREQKLQKEGQLPIATHSNKKRASQSQSQSDSDSVEYQRIAREQERLRQPEFLRPERSNRYVQESQETVNIDNTIRNANVQNQLPLPSLKLAPLNPFIISPLTKQGMAGRIHTLLEEVCQAVGTPTDKESIAESESLSNLGTISKIIRLMDYEDILRLYEEIVQQSTGKLQKIKRKYLLDCITIAGTNPALMVTIKLIEIGDLIGEEASQQLMYFPAYLRHPTAEILNQIDELIESKQLENQEQVKITGVLVHTEILFQACVSSRSKQSRYPVAVYGQFCNEELACSRYAPRLIDEVRRALKGGQNSDKWVTVYLNALGNTGCRSVVPLVQEILDGSSNSFQKTNAIYALKRVIISRDVENRNQQNQRDIPVDRMAKDPITDNFVETKVLPILASVVFDRSEHFAVRIAAIQMMTYCTYADLSLWQQMALLTWRRQESQQVKSFVYSTIKQLATMNRPLSEFQWRLQRKALAVYPMTNHFQYGYALSKNLFHSEVLQHISAGEFFQASYSGSRDSNIPNNVYYRSYHQLGAGGIGFNPLEFSVHGRSLSKLADLIMKQVVGQRPHERNPHPELHELKSLLGIESRDMDESPHGSLYVKLRNEVQRMFLLSAKDIETNFPIWKMNAFLNLKKGLNVNYQKVIQVAEHSIEMASGLGIPFIFHYRNPLMVSLRGEMKLVNNNALKDVQVVSHLHIVYAWKTHGKVAFKVPFIGKKFQAGVQRHFAFEAPLLVSVRRAESKEIVIAVTPMQLNQDRPQGTIDLLTYHQTPYTAILTDEFYPTIHPKGGKMEIVHSESQSPVSQTHQSFGEQALGFAYTLNLKSDFRQEKESVAGWVRFLRKFKNPWTLYKLGSLGDNDVKFVNRKLVLDLERSPAKTLVLAIGAKRQDGTLEDWSVQSSGSSSSSSSSSESQEQNRRHSNSNNRVSGSDEQYRSRKVSRKFGSIPDFPSSSSESSSSEERTNRQGNSKERSSAEQVNQINERRRTIVVALVAKKHALQTVEQTNNVYPVLGKGENYVQYLVQIIRQQNRLFLRVASGDAANQAAEKFRQVTSSSSVKSVIEAIIKSPNDQKQQEGCIEFKGKYEGPRKANQNILVVLRHTLLNGPLSAEAQGELRFGKSCNSLEYVIKLQAKLRRGEKMTRWALNESPEAKRCIEDEKTGFASSPICLWVARNQASLFNRVNLKLKANRQLPLVLRNVTQMVQDVARYTYFASQSYNPVPEGSENEQTSKPDSIEINYRFTPDGQYFNVEVLKPKSRLEFNNVKANSLIQAVLPMSATVSVVDSVREALMGNNAQRICSVEQNKIATFDNVTTTFRRSVASGCYTLLTKQSASSLLPPMAVLVKNIGTNNMNVRVLLGGNTKIDVLTSSNSNGQFTVKVNGQQRQLPYIHKNHQDQEAQSSDYIAKIVEMPNVGVQIVTPTIKVAADGKRVLIFSHPIFHNSTSGVCGNNDGEKVADMRSPRNIPLSRGTLLVASYTYDGKDGQGQQCKLDSKLQREIQKEETLARSNRQWFPRNYLRSTYQPQQWQQQHQQQQWQQQQWQPEQWQQQHQQQQWQQQQWQPQQWQQQHQQQRWKQELLADGDDKCDCKYRTGGCVISKAPPTGHKCRCNYAPNSYTCSGHTQSCNSHETCPANCLSESCCKTGDGNCGGYDQTQ